MAKSVGKYKISIWLVVLNRHLNLFTDFSTPLSSGRAAFSLDDTLFLFERLQKYGDFAALA